MTYPIIELVKKDKTGKIANRILRESGQIPVVLYGKKENITGSMAVVEAKKLVSNYYFMTQVFSIKIDGKSYLCIAKDVQFNPVTDCPDHFDFKIVDAGEKIVVNVPVSIIGQEKSVGIKRGGHVVINAYNVKLNTKVGHIPQEVQIDISDSVIGSKYYLSDANIENATPVYNCLIARVSGRQTKEEAAANAEAAKEAAPAAK